MMTNYKELAKKIGIVGITDLLVRFKAFVLIPIISKSLGPSSYGAWAQVIVTVTMLLPVVLLGMQFGISRYVPGRAKSELKNEISSILLLITISSLAGAMLLIGMSDLLSEKFFGGKMFSFLVKLGGIYLVTMSLREVFLSYFIAREKASFYSLLVSMDAILTIPILLLLTYFGYGVDAIMIAFIALNIMIIFLSLIAVRRDIGFTFPVFENMNKYFIYSLPFIPLIWFLWIVNSSDRYFLGYFKTIKEVGIYSACYGISYFVVNLIVGPLYLVLQPHITSAWNDSSYMVASKFINNLVKYTIIIILPSAIGFSIIAKPVIKYFTSSDFLSGVMVIPFILSGYAFYLTAVCIQIIVNLSNSPKRLIPVYFTIALINIALNILIIPKMGMLGAAISTSISFFVYLLLILALVKKKNILDIDLTLLLKVIIAAAITGLLMSMVPHENFLNIILFIIYYAGLYTGIALFLGIFNRSELEKLKSIFSR